MNKQAENHLAKAKDYIVKGDEYYRKAKPEIHAAQEKGANTSEIARFLSMSRTWVTDVLAWDGKGTLYGKDTGRRQIDQAKQLVREAPHALIADDASRASLGRAFDEHYTKKAQESAARKREKEVERKGGEDEHAEYQRRQHVTEVVSVARGATSGWRFVASQFRSLELDGGVIGELNALIDETEGFLNLLSAALNEGDVTDAEFAELLKEEA